MLGMDMVFGYERQLRIYLIHNDQSQVALQLEYCLEGQDTPKREDFNPMKPYKGLTKHRDRFLSYPLLFL